MKLLGWMHQKLRQNSIETFRDFAIGNCCACLSAQQPHDEKDLFAIPNFSSRYAPKSSESPAEEYGNSLSCFTSRFEENLESETSTEISELFHGFLAIGTLGSEAAPSEPATPTFAVTLDNMTKEAVEVTEDDLKLINNELEKFLEAESQEEWHKGSSRNSYVSTITLDSPQMEAVEDEGPGDTVIFPLQGYLFGSSVESPETKIEMKKQKASLLQLFQETRKTGGNCSKNSEMGATQVEPTHKSSKHIMKKFLKKLCTSSRPPSLSTGGDATASSLPKKTFHKVLQMFRRKIHPENATNIEEMDKYKAYKSKKAFNNNNSSHKDLIDQDKFNKSSAQGLMSTEREKASVKLQPPEIARATSDDCREHWIKTDADYLVLEL
ncbi:protein LAZY 1-like [Rhodamnia argentea]|uniref:Protein LAZY 1-like n=1 Tax=Rhodamnia argentea TaxID=178133 RepID=A0ABM3GV68_9MYRT|nr:protein LAZY 1-like [Rhodamnia argentea]